MNSSKFRPILWLGLFILLPLISALSTSNGVASSIITNGRFQDTFEDATSLEDLNQTMVSDSSVHLSGDVHQVWEISSQVSFQSGTLDKVDAEVVPGALQLAPATLDFNPNQLVSNVSLYHYFEPPALTGDGDQVLHLAWSHTEEDDIFYRCSTDAGQNWTAIELLTSDGTDAIQHSPEMIVDAAGTVYAAWYDERADTNGDIYFASRSGCGGDWSTPMPLAVAATTESSQDNPSIAVDDGNNLYLVWEEDDNVYFSLSSDSGQTWLAKRKLNDDSGAIAKSPDIVVDQDGQNILVAWAYDPGDAKSNIYTVTSNDGGQTWFTNAPVALDPTQSQHAPTVARTLDGSLYVAWASNGIFVSRSLDGGKGWETAVSVHDEQFGLFWSGTRLIADNQGNLYLTWHDQRNRMSYIHQPPNYYDIFLAYSQDGGQSWSSNLQVNDDSPLSGVGSDRIDHMYPAVTTNQAGQLFMAWWDERGMCEVVPPSTICTAPHKEIYFASTPGHAFATDGTFTSAIHDASGQATWDTITWTADTPIGTALALYTRSGDSPVPDPTWSDWSPAYGTSGDAVVSPSSRYIQARAQLTTTDVLTTPVLYDMRVQYRPFIWEQTTQSDFAGSMQLDNVDLTAVSGSVQLFPDVTFVPEQKVNDQNGGVEQSDEKPALAIFGNSVYLAWKDTRDDSEGDIYFSRSTDGGQTWGANIKINDDSPGADQSAPYLAAQDNNVYLVWYDEREGGIGQIYSARSTDGGLSWQPNQRVNENAISAVGDPAVAVGLGNNIHATWAIDKTFVYTNRSADAGQSWQGNIAVGGTDMGFNFSGRMLVPGIATNGSGDVFVAYLDARNVIQDDSCPCLRDMEIYVGRSSDNGNSWDIGDHVAGDDGMAWQSLPHLAYHDNTLYIVWIDHQDIDLTDDTDPAIYFARSSNGGQNWLPTNVQVNTNDVPFFGQNPVIEVDDNGVLYVSWNGHFYDNARDVLLARSLDDGDTWQIEQRVNTDAIGAKQAVPALKATTPGKLYLAWQDERNGVKDLYFTTSIDDTSSYSNGLLVSSVLDTEGAAQWGDISWSASLPTNTSIILYTRTGNTTNPDDGSWSDWSGGYTVSPANINSPTGKYLQYRVELSTTDPSMTPVLHDVSIEYGRYPLQGSAVSLPVLPPTGFGEWQTIDFTASIPSGTTLTVDLLDSAGNVLITDVNSGDSLTTFPPAQYPGLRLRANLATSDPSVTPSLNDWSLTWHPPPAENHVQVIYENGEAASGVDIYQNGAFLDTTNHLGFLNLSEPPQVGDKFSVLKTVTEVSTNRDGHDGWAYRIHLTNIEVDSQGGILTHVVSNTGAQTVIIRPENVLILYNLVVSIEWDATDAYLDEIARAVQSASDYLYDLSDGQMAFGQIAIYDGGTNWADADIQISTKNIVRPHAYIGGITSDDKAHVIRVGRGWDGYSGNQGSWDEPDGFRTLAHEFGHYALYLYDEYIGYTFDESGNLTGQSPTSCTDSDYRIPANDATNASAMDDQYVSSEFSARNVPGMWSDSCEKTAQWQLTERQLGHGESTWETIARRYGDTANPPRWMLTTPADRGGVLAGPNNLPTDVLALPTVSIHNGGTSEPPRLLAIFDQAGKPFRSAIVALYKTDGRVIGQGFTDGNGQLTIYGAEEGDILRVASFDSGLAGHIIVGTEKSLSINLAPIGGLARQVETAMSGIPHLRIIAEPSQTPGQVDLLFFLLNFGPGADPSVVVTVPGSEKGYAPVVNYSSGKGTYEGQISFSATAQGMGHIRATGAVGNSLVRLHSTYRLQRVFNDTEGDIYSDDGNLSLHLEPDSLPGNEAYLAVMSPGALPGPPPKGLVPVGDAYDVTASGAFAMLDKPGVLQLHYDGALVNPLLLPEGMDIYRWNANNETWQAVGGRMVEEQMVVVAPVTTVGTYALLAPPGPWMKSWSVFLPVIINLDK